MIKFLILFTVFISFASSACTYQTKNVSAAATPAAPPQVLKECKDIDCFIKAAEKCEPATFLHKQEVDLGAEIISKDDRYEIKGGTDTACSLYLKVLKWESVRNEKWYDEMKKSGETPREPDPEIVKSMKERMKKFTGTDGQCTFPTKRLSTLFKRMKDQRFSTQDFKDASCKGSWFVAENGFYEGF